MKNKINKTAIISAAGVGISLLSLIILFSKDTVFSFLSTLIVAPFGFIGFWILLPFIFIVGLYMILRRKLIRFKVGISLWGVLLIIISLLLLTSIWAEQTLVPGGELSFGSFSNEYLPALSKLNNDPTNTLSGGGIVGYFLTSVLFTSITKLGTTIVSYILMFIGICLVLNQQIKKLFLFLRSLSDPNRPKREKRVKEKKIKEKKNKVDKKIDDEQFDDEYESVSFEEDISPVPLNNATFEENQSTNVIQNDNLNNFDNFNQSHGLMKAKFTLGGEDPVRSTFSGPVFSQNQRIEPQYQQNNFASNYQENIPQQNPIEQNNPQPIFENQNKPVEQPTFVNQGYTEPQNQFVQPTPQASPAPQPPVDKLHRPQPRANLVQNYIYPPIDLLDFHEDAGDADKNNQSTQETTDKINEIFEHLRIGARVVGSTVGPCVTRYDVQTNSDVSVNSVARFVEDISIRLGGVPVRFEKIVFGKATSGLEIPNAVRTNVGLRESISKLPTGIKNLRQIPFGKNIAGELLYANLSDFPHMLVSGTTGSGKTIFVHSVILTLIMRNKPEELKLVLIDPKKVEMAYYEKIPHLLCPNISQSQQAYVAMKKLVDEMERRYNLFAANKQRDIKGFNEFAKQNDIQPLPYIVVFIDEYADLVEEVKDIKIPVVRIAQKARAAGIHLVIATQRPSVNVIDGVIKANVAVRAALMVASQVDSISIIGQAGAEALLGNGDMIVDCPLINRSVKPRVQGCFVDVPEINRVCDFLRSHYPEQYDPEFLNLEEHEEEEAEVGGQDVVIDKDMAEEKLYELIKDQIVERDYCSISYIQRTYGVGFPKAGRLFNKLIQDGYVARGGDAKGSKVLIKTKSEQQMGTIEQSTYIPDEAVIESTPNNIDNEN